MINIFAIAIIAGLNIPPFEMPTLPALPEPSNSNRIVLWENNVSLGSYAAQSQSVSGGDEGCLKFAGQLATTVKHDQKAFCLSSEGKFLFEIVCKPPNPGVTLNGRVILPKIDAVCNKV